MVLGAFFCWVQGEDGGLGRRKAIRCRCRNRIRISWEVMSVDACEFRGRGVGSRREVGLPCGKGEVGVVENYCYNLQDYFGWLLGAVCQKVRARCDRSLVSSFCSWRALFFPLKHRGTASQAYAFYSRPRKTEYWVRAALWRHVSYVCSETAMISLIRDWAIEDS